MARQLITSSRLFGKQESLRQNTVPFSSFTNAQARPLTENFPLALTSSPANTNRSFVDGIFSVLQEGVRQAPRIIQATQGREVVPDSIQIVTGPAQTSIDQATATKQRTIVIPDGAFRTPVFKPADPTVKPLVAPSIIAGVDDQTLFLVAGGLFVLLALGK